MAEKQSIENQKGEILFRRKLYQQQVEGRSIFHDEYDSAGIEAVLRQRVKRTLDDMTVLQERGIPLSPYVEIGAERGQRSLAIENHLSVHGAAVDLSYDLLKSSCHYQEVFKFPNSPLKICCDANTLPFLSNSVPFVFCYETLHHFPDPSPVVTEALRVLQPGGCFFFEEPFKQTFHCGLYEGSKIYSQPHLNRSTVKKVLDRLFMKRSCNEVEHGVLENDQITLNAWREALSGFDLSEVHLRYGPLKAHFANPNSLTYFALYLSGGNIFGLCRKPGDIQVRHSPVENLLACPSCRARGTDSGLSRSKLVLRCDVCSATYPIHDDIAFLIIKSKLEDLYPELLSGHIPGAPIRMQ